MVTTENLEDLLREVGSRLSPPPSAVDELLPILDQTERLLEKVDQSPTQSMLDALRPSMTALASKELLGHADIDVKAVIASCFSEITRITAPDAPYDDDLMKEIFQTIVQTFANLDDLSSRSFAKRVSILETVAKVRSCVLMLDLECDALVLEMFHHFLKTIRPNHSERIFSSMEMIMTLVLEESEDISTELIFCLLDSVKNENKDILPVARRLGEKVIISCAEKLKPYLLELSQSTGLPLSEYGKVVSSICHGCKGQHDTNASGEIKRSDKGEKAMGHCEEITTLDNKPPKSFLSNGAEQMANGESTVEPSSARQKPESPHCADQSNIAVDKDAKDASDNMGDASVKLDAVSDLGQKTADTGADKKSLTAQTKIRKRGRPSSKLIAARRRGTKVAGQSISSPQHNISEMVDKSLSCKDSDLKGSKVIGTSDNIEKSAIVERGSDERYRRKKSRKALTSESNHEDSLQKLRRPKVKLHDNIKPIKDTAGESALKEIISKSASKVANHQSNLGEGSKTNSKRKHDLGAKKISRTPRRNRVGGNLVGSRIRVWWPMDEKFYDGIIDSYDHTSKKHKIVYSDGDIETLLLKKERWKLAEDNSNYEMEQTMDSAIPGEESEEPKSKRAKLTPRSISRETKELLEKSGAESSRRRKGRPPKATAVNHDENPLSNLKERKSRKSKDDGSKSESKLKNDDDESTHEIYESSQLTSKLDKETKDDARKSSRKSRGSSKFGTKLKKDDKESKGESYGASKLTSKTDTESKDDVHKSSRKSKGGVSKSGTKFKDDGESKGDGFEAGKCTSKTEMSDDDQKLSRKSKDSSLKSGIKVTTKDDGELKGDGFEASKSISKADTEMTDDVKSSMKSSDGMHRSSSGKVSKDAEKGQSSKDTRQSSGLNLRGAAAPKTDSETKAVNAFEKGKTKVPGPQKPVKVRSSTTETDASTRRRRKLKGPT